MVVSRYDPQIEFQIRDLLLMLTQAKSFVHRHMRFSRSSKGVQDLVIGPRESINLRLATGEDSTT